MVATGLCEVPASEPSQTNLSPQEFAPSPAMDQVEQQENLLPDPLPTDEWSLNLQRTRRRKVLTLQLCLKMNQRSIT